MKIVLFLSAVLFLVSCHTNTEQASSSKDSTQVDSIHKAPEFKNDTVVSQYIKKLKLSYTQVPLYTRLSGQFIFMVSNSSDSLALLNLFSKENLYGLVDEKNQLILPVSYEKIFNPDATAKGYIEIKNQDMVGLFNYTNYSVLVPEFDVIFPSTDPAFVAIGQRDKKFIGIKSDFTTENLISGPTYAEQGEKWKFNSSKPGAFWYDSYGTVDFADGVVVTPSYLLVLKFMPEIMCSLFTEKEANFGVEINAQVNAVFNMNSDYVAVVSEFIDMTSGARPYHTVTNQATVVDKHNKVLDAITLIEYDSNDLLDIYEECGNKKEWFRLVSDQTIEVVVQGVSYKDEENVHPNYFMMPMYSYFKVQPDGRIFRRESARIFNFTAFVELTDLYLEGCFFTVGDGMPNISATRAVPPLVTTHKLNKYDLELMRNEILAEYGQTFTGEWKLYFESKHWYKPETDNVEDKLSTLDKKNLKFIEGKLSQL